MWLEWVALLLSTGGNGGKQGATDRCWEASWIIIDKGGAGSTRPLSRQLVPMNVWAHNVVFCAVDGCHELSRVWVAISRVVGYVSVPDEAQVVVSGVVVVVFFTIIGSDKAV
jgi:hypothetical protein